MYGAHIISSPRVPMPGIGMSFLAHCFRFCATCSSFRIKVLFLVSIVASRIDLKVNIRYNSVMPDLYRIFYSDVTVLVVDFKAP